MNNMIQINKIHLIDGNKIICKCIKFDNNRVFVLFTGYLLAFNVTTNLSVSTILNLTHSGMD